METLTIQLTSPKILKLIKELEELKLLRVIDNDKSEYNSLSKKYAGKLPKDIAEKLQQHIETSRNEWNKSI